MPVGGEREMVSRAEVLAEFTAPGAPYELRTVDTERGPHRIFAAAPPSLRELAESARSDAEYLVYGDERYTFDEAYRRAAAIAHVLVHDCGVIPGDRVAISMRNYPEWVLGFIAATSVGAVAVAMNSLWQADELHYGLADSGASVLLADGERVAMLAGLDAASAPTVLAVRADDEQLAGAAGLQVHRLDERLMALGEVPMPPASPQPDDPATIFYTSGSTGHPKGVLSTHRNVISALMSWELDTLVGAQLLAARRAAASDPTTRAPEADTSPAAPVPPRPAPRQGASLLGVPLFHVTGCHAIALASLRAQRKVVAMYRWDPEVAAGLIEAEHINAFVATPAMVGDLLRVATETGHDLSSLRLVGGGGAPRPPSQVSAITSSFAKAAPNNGWGMTETNAIGAGITGGDYSDRPSTSGRVSAVLDLRVVDDDGNVLGVGERGELQVRGTSVFVGYWNQPDATADSFVDGWFRTGDVAYLDEDGFVFIVDRIKDLIIRGGENIGCGHVEAALLLHPLVREAAVYSVPDERLGEEVGATVFAAAGLDVDELLVFLEDHLGRFEIPSYLTAVMTPLPRTATGKIFKRQLQAEMLHDLRAAGVID